MEIPKFVVSLYISNILLEKVDAQASKEGLSRNEFVTRAIEKYLLVIPKNNLTNFIDFENDSPVKLNEVVKHRPKMEFKCPRCGSKKQHETYGFTIHEVKCPYFRSIDDLIEMHKD